MFIGSKSTRSLYEPKPYVPIVWRTIDISYNRKESIVCGTIHIYKNFGEYSNHTYNIYWKYRINLKDTSDPKKLAIEEKEYAYSESIPEMCGSSVEDLIIFEKVEDYDSEKLDISAKKKVSSAFLFYFFTKFNEKDESMYKEPCLVLSTFNFCPQITIIGHEYTTIIYKEKYEILAFKLDEDKPTTFDISLNLQIGGKSLSYYNKDNVAITRMLNF